MRNKEFQDYLATFPDNMEVKFYRNRSNGTSTMDSIHTMNEWAMQWSDTARFDEDKDKVVWGNGKKFILLNYPIQ